MGSLNFQGEAGKGLGRNNKLSYSKKETKRERESI